VYARKILVRNWCERYQEALRAFIYWGRLVVCAQSIIGGAEKRRENGAGVVMIGGCNR